MHSTTRTVGNLVVPMSLRTFRFWQCFIFDNPNLAIFAYSHSFPNCVDSWFNSVRTPMFTSQLNSGRNVFQLHVLQFLQPRDFSLLGCDVVHFPPSDVYRCYTSLTMVLRTDVLTFMRRSRMCAPREAFSNYWHWQAHTSCSRPSESGCVAEIGPPILKQWHIWEIIGSHSLDIII